MYRGKIVIYSTTSILEGYRIKEYLGVLAGETIMGANAFKAGRYSRYRLNYAQMLAGSLLITEAPDRRYPQENLAGVKM